MRCCNDDGRQTPVECVKLLNYKYSTSTTIMFFGNSTQDTRAPFFLSWQKHMQHQPLSPLEQQLVTVINDHPEYHPLFEQTTDTPIQDAEPDNPFLHLGLHLAIRDQVSLNRPNGISEIYHTLSQRYPDPHYVEHLLMEPLAWVLWDANRHQRAPNEVAYLNACKELI